MIAAAFLANSAEILIGAIPNLKSVADHALIICEPGARTAFAQLDYPEGNVHVTQNRCAGRRRTYAESKEYRFLTTINPGEGFWVNAKVPFTLTLPAGTPVASSSYQTNLIPGWNLIAIGEELAPAAFNVALSATPPPAGVTPLNIVSLWAWDAEVGNWYFWAPSKQADGAAKMTFTSAVSNSAP